MDITPALNNRKTAGVSLLLDLAKSTVTVTTARLTVATVYLTPEGLAALQRGRAVREGGIMATRWGAQAAH